MLWRAEALTRSPNRIDGATPEQTPSRTESHPPRSGDETGDSRDLGGVTQSHRGEEEEERQGLRVPRRPLRTDPPEGTIPGPGSHAGAKRIESRHDMTGKATLRYKDGESPG
ncbi:hypothetical protein G5I_01496 [Acromyrmex echinatior]|uniref:Uncharacterized protein n=1 Tax=Acromyrmex echinatior TaxID=103372 RepID=F4W7S3_ACREC|nr:hypothetical protein G5I_01496 [Acromyrmex echinatior]